jgi:replicative DNA helicase
MTNIVPIRGRRESLVLEPSNHAGTPPPHELDAEAAVLSAVMIDAGDVEALRSIADLLRPDHFYSEAHRRIYEAALALMGRGVAPDTVAIGSELKDHGRLQQAGGLGYLTELLNASPAVANARNHAEIVFDAWRQRQVLLRCQEAAAQIYDGVPPTETQAFLDGLGKSLVQVAVQSPRSSSSRVGDLFKDFFRASAREARADARTLGLTTTFPTLDRMTGGLHKGKKITISGLPGGGKTVLGKQIALANALAGVPTLLFVTEQTKEEITDLILASIAEIDSRRVRQIRTTPKDIRVSDGEWQSLAAAAKLYYRVPLYIEHSETLTVEDIATRTRELALRLRSKDGLELGLVGVDHLHRLTPSIAPATPKRNEQIDHMTTALKRLAQELEIVVLEMAQQKSRAHENGRPAKPMLGDVQWSSKVEQESDAVIHLWEPAPGRHVLVVPKVRGGEVGEVEVVFDKAHSKMFEPV